MRIAAGQQWKPRSSENCTCRLAAATTFGRARRTPDVRSGPVRPRARRGGGDGTHTHRDTTEAGAGDALCTRAVPFVARFRLFLPRCPMVSIHPSTVRASRHGSTRRRDASKQLPAVARRRPLRYVQASDRPSDRAALAVNHNQQPFFLFFLQSKPKSRCFKGTHNARLYHRV